MTTHVPVRFASTGIRLPHAPSLPNPQQTIPLAGFARARDGNSHWVVPYTDSAAAIAWADAAGVPVEPAVRDFDRSRWLTELAAMNRARAATLTSRPRPDVTGLTSTLLATQDVVVYAAAHAHVTHPARRGPGHRALLVADEPGLGKTIMSLAAARIAGQECGRVIVVVPSSLTQNWVDEMSQHFAPGAFTPWIATTRTSTAPPAGVDIVVIGWSILTDWVQQLTDWAPDALIIDEGHYGKAGKQETGEKEEVLRDGNGAIQRDAQGNAIRVMVPTIVAGSSRATALIDIAKQVIAQHGFVLALTGTPIVNRPLELLPLLEALGLLHLVGGSQAYKRRYCGPKQDTVNGRVVTTYTGATNLLDLNDRLAASGHYIRRTKSVLIDAGIMKRKYVDGVFTYDHSTPTRPWMIQATPDQMREYLKVQRQAEDLFAQEAEAISAETRSPFESPRVQQRVAATGYKHLALLTKMRSLAGLAKVPYVIAWTQRLVDQGEKVVIAAHHREPVDAYAAAFTGLKIQGGIGVKAIEKAKALFNETPVSEHPVLVLSIEAGKTGHTLCKQTLHGAGPACAQMVFAEQVWTPGDEAQAQDRIWRIGQDREVHITNALLQHSVDERMFTSRARKRRVFDALVDGIDPEAGEKAAERAGAGMLALQLAGTGRSRHAQERATGWSPQMQGS